MRVRPSGRKPELDNGFSRALCDECGHDFLIAFSCRGRGVCLSCNTRSMAETAVQLVDLALAGQSVGQGVGGTIRDVESQIDAW